MKLLKLWNLEVQLWVPILKAIGITEKIEHENELKFWPSPKWNLLMGNIREFNHKLIEVSHVEIGLQ